jgi:hypothetical protein
MSKCVLRKCSQCGEKIATWFNEYNDSNSFKYYCDDCVPRGSVCNVDNIEDFGEPLHNHGYNIMWWDKSCVHADLLRKGSLVRDSNSFYYEYLDKEDRRSPSDDFSFSKDGFLISEDEDIYYVSYDTIVKTFDDCSYNLSNYECVLLKDKLGEIFLNHRDIYNRKKIIYTLLMSKFGSFIWFLVNSKIIKANKIRKFYLRFKDELSKKKLTYISN